jgi:peptidoglycan/LPS O-acetylase OafA/YrhL
MEFCTETGLPAKRQEGRSPPDNSLRPGGLSSRRGLNEGADAGPGDGRGFALRAGKLQRGLMPKDHPSLSLARYESLDVWRGLACLLVIVYHATSFRTENYLGHIPSVGLVLLLLTTTFKHGVTLFFVISGYCISAAVEASARRQTGITDYFRRRVRRIFPPYWTLLACVIISGALVHALGGGRFLWERSLDNYVQLKQPADLSGSQWLGNLTLTELWLPRLFGRAPRLFEGSGHAWTLAYEEQFYAVCGLLLIASRRRMNRFFAGALGVTLLTFVTASSPVLRAHVGGLFLDGQWMLFACGIAVYYDRVHAGQRQRWAIRAALLALLALVLVKRSGPELVIGPAFALLLNALQPWDAAWARSRKPAILWWSGLRCYSLYLVHWPIIRPLSRLLYESGVRSVWGTLLITLPVSLAVSMLAAWAFHAAVERRFLNRPSRSHTAAPEARSAPDAALASA